jgi:hypothetical protein
MFIVSFNNYKIIMEDLDIKKIDSNKAKSPKKSRELSPYSKAFFLPNYSDQYGLSPHSKPFFPKNLTLSDNKEYLKKSINNSEQVIDYNSKKTNK